MLKKLFMGIFSGTVGLLYIIEAIFMFIGALALIGIIAFLIITAIAIL